MKKLRRTCETVCVFGDRNDVAHRRNPHRVRYLLAGSDDRFDGWIDPRVLLPMVFLAGLLLLYLASGYCRENEMTKDSKCITTQSPLAGLKHRAPARMPFSQQLR